MMPTPPPPPPPPPSPPPSAAPTMPAPSGPSLPPPTFLASPEPSSAPSEQRGPTWAVVAIAALVAAGLAVAAMAFLGAQDDDGGTSSASTLPAAEPDSSGVASEPAEPPVVDQEPTDVVGENVVTDTPSDADGGVVAEPVEPSEVADTVAPEESSAAEVSDESTAVEQPGAGARADEVPESRAVVRNGQIYLEGAVPNQAASDEIEALAAEILGPDNVFNEYVIDERAGDPSLGNITVEDTINFATGSSVLLPESEGLLTQGLALMAIRPAVIIEIVGHTDDRGSIEYNQQLSEERAAAVKQWFVERGVDPSRLITSGAGESQPIADNATEEGRRLNRRIQLFLQNILGDA